MSPTMCRRPMTFPEESFAFIEEAGRQLRMRAFAKRERYPGASFWPLNESIGSLFRDVVGKVVFAADVGGLPARVKVDLNQDDLATGLRRTRRVKIRRRHGNHPPQRQDPRVRDFRTE